VTATVLVRSADASMTNDSAVLRLGCANVMVPDILPVFVTNDTLHVRLLPPSASAHL
jgi:hypothetical protein